jgi:hypothetical protein
MPLFSSTKITGRSKEGSHVQRFVEGAWFAGPVAEEGGHACLVPAGGWVAGPTDGVAVA